jgi:hypothetical protein
VSEKQSQTEATPKGLHEVPADDMADAPPARPYGDAISDEHRAALEEAGVYVEPASGGKN